MVGAWKGCPHLSGSSCKVTLESQVKQWWVRGRDAHIYQVPLSKSLENQKLNNGVCVEGMSTFIRFLFQIHFRIKSLTIPSLGVLEFYFIFWTKEIVAYNFLRCHVLFRNDGNI